MSRELVIETRARAIFNKFWDTVAQDPQWLRQVFQDEPEILNNLLRAFTSKNPSGDFAKVVSSVRQVALLQAREKATTQVDALSPDIVDWVQETLEYN